MSTETTGPVIDLDSEGLEKLRTWQRTIELSRCSLGHGPGSSRHYRLMMEDDGTIIMSPISELEAAMWRSGLMDKIEDNRAHPERTIMMDPDEL